MSRPSRLPVAVKWHAAGLLIAAIAVLAEFLVGVPGFPKVPPGPFILAIAGILVLWLMPRFRWILLVGLAAALFITIGGFIDGSSWGRIGDPGDFGPFITTTIQWVALAIALVAGVAAAGPVLRRRGAAVTTS